MGLIGTYRTRKAVSQLLAAEPLSTLDKQKAVALVKQQRESAVPMLIEELSRTKTPESVTELLSKLLDDLTLPAYREALINADQRSRQMLVEVLSSNDRYDPNQLLDWLKDDQANTAALVTVLTHRKDALDAGAVLALCQTLVGERRAPVFRLLEEVADEALLPELIKGLESDDWRTRTSLARALARFRADGARDALSSLLSDPNKTVRLTALGGLAEFDVPIDVKPITKLLHDPDLTVQSKAIETIIQINDPGSVHLLIEVLQDESEYVRRAAVEVLNEIGDASSIKDLLGALRDQDWWVRVRAADALGTIGGAKVVEAMLALIKDEDEFIRRCAIEILNTTKDERAFNALVEALEDDDWWVRERAIDAMAALGDERAVPVLIELLKENPEATPLVIRALSTLGDARAVPALLKQLESGNERVVAHALSALEQLTGKDEAQKVERAVRKILPGASGKVQEVAQSTLDNIATRFGAQTRVASAVGGLRGPREARTRSLLANASLGGRSSAQQEDAVDTADDETSPPNPDVQATVQTEQIIDASALQPGDVLADRYRIIRYVRSGAFGIVMLVEDTMISEEVILKFLRPHVASDEKVIKRFIQELRYARKISHENVIRIHDFLSFGHSYAISMEYFHSDPLSSAIEEAGRIEPDRAVQITLDICNGMSCAHQHSIVHRDLKPANVLIDEAGQVKIVDFGLAAAASFAGSRLTTAGMVVGTPTYMSPEQIRGQPFDARTDIYSVGIILYEMLTGRPPYDAEDPMAILFKHLEGKPTPPSEIVDSIPESLEAVIRKAMAVEPEDRYQNIEELQDALNAELVKESS